MRGSQTQPEAQENPSACMPAEGERNPRLSLHLSNQNPRRRKVICNASFHLFALKVNGTYTILLLRSADARATKPAATQGKVIGPRGTFDRGRDAHRVFAIRGSKICLDLFQDIGMVSSRAAHAKVFINGDYYGLYISVEHVDDSFF